VAVGNGVGEAVTVVVGVAVTATGEAIDVEAGPVQPIITRNGIRANIKPSLVIVKTSSYIP
jgi:hypothetical protein